MNVSIIIISYNTKELTQNCLKSIYEHTTGISFEIIVVDNASSDGSRQMLKVSFPCIKIIESNINLGFGKANNLAIEKAIGKYIFLLNSDTILLNNAILLNFNYMEEYNTDKSIGAIGGLLLDAEKKPTISFGYFPTVQSEWSYIKKKINKKINKNISVDCLQLRNNLFVNVEFITGADLFIPKYVFDKIGAFDPIFFMYYEETDLQKRMADQGFQRLIISGPQIIHFEGGSISTPSKFSYSRFVLSQKSLLIYMNKHFFGLNYMVFRIFIILIRSTIIFDRRFNFNEKIKALKLILSGAK